jgi:anti-sigma factor RsiW
MECKSARSYIDGYLDRELDPARGLEVEAHLRDCNLCSQSYKEREGLRDALRGAALHFKAPAELEKRVRRAVRETAKIESSPKWRSLWSWASVAGSLVAAALALFVLLPYFGSSSEEDLLSREVISGHVRSLMADHLTDVVSSDRHTVRPWFNGKLDFSPPVEDLASMGFLLEGGRLDYLNNRAVAALIYRRDKHVINVFVWPSLDTKSTSVQTTARQGYNVLHWTSSGLNFWVVSDLERDQLEKLIALLKGSSPRSR